MFGRVMCRSSVKKTCIQIITASPDVRMQYDDTSETDDNHSVKTSFYFSAYFIISISSAIIF